MTTKDILREKVGVCRQYVKIFSEMCMIADLSVKNIRGFSKAYTYLPGKMFHIHLHSYYTIFILTRHITYKNQYNTYVLSS